MKKIGYLLSLFLFCLSLFLPPFIQQVGATDSGTVTATVTAQSISVSLNKSTTDFGTIAVNAAQDTTSNGTNDSITATNNGNIAEKFEIMAGNSTNWTLDTATGTAEHYTLKFCITTCDTSPSWSSVGIDPSYATLVASLAKDGQQAFDLQVHTPSSTTQYGQQSITVTVLATTP